MKCQTCGDTLTSLEFQCLTCNPFDTWFNLESMIKPKYIVPEDIKFGRRLDEEDQYLGSCQKETYAVTNPTSDLKLVEALDEVVEMFLELNEHEDKKLHATSAIEWLRRKYGYSN